MVFRGKMTPLRVIGFTSIGEGAKAHYEKERVSLTRRGSTLSKLRNKETFGHQNLLLESTRLSLRKAIS